MVISRELTRSVEIDEVKLMILNPVRKFLLSDRRGVNPIGMKCVEVVMCIVLELLLVTIATIVSHALAQVVHIPLVHIFCDVVVPRS